MLNEMFVASLFFGGAQVLPHNIPFLCPSSPHNVPSGQTVTLSGTITQPCIQVPNGSTLLLADNLRLTTATIQVLPGGRLSQANPAGGRNIEVTWMDVAPSDPEQWGLGLVGIGDVILKGDPRPTRARMTAELSAGATTVQLVSTAGMRVGEQLQLNHSNFRPEGDHGTPPQFVTITALTDTSATFTPANIVLRRAARNWDGSIHTYPEVGYVSRGITFQSENPNGNRGHAVWTGAAVVDIEGVAFRDMGRTVNHLTVAGSQQPGRYSTHFHHLHSPSPVRFVGNAVIDGRKWGISVHQTSRVLVQNNLFTNHQGWCIGTEDGVNELDVTFDGNMLAGCTGDNNRGDRGQGEWGTNPLMLGTAGVCVWTMGPGVNVTNNTCYNPAVAGFKPWGQRNDGGMDLGTWRGNECWSGLICFGAWYTAGGIIEDQLVANVWHGTMNYPTWRMTYRGWVVRGDPDFQTKLPFGWSTGFNHGDYSTTETTVENADIQNMSVGVRPAWAIAGDTAGEGSIPRTYRILNSKFCNNFSDVHYWVEGGSSPDYVKPLHTTIVQNSQHCAASPTWVAMTGETRQNSGDPVMALNVANFNGFTGDNFRVYSNEVAPSGTTTRARVKDRVSGGGTPPPPPPTDTDGDGVPDADDKCPSQPGPASNGGCPVSPPPVDTDGDGLVDSEDKCPTQAGPISNGGCPVVVPPPVDTDGDGVIDADDKCPTQSGPASNGGCPLPPPDQCVATPLSIVVTSWPNPAAGSRQLRYRSSQAIVSFVFDLNLTRAVFTDTRGCAATVVK